MSWRMMMECSKGMYKENGVYAQGIETMHDAWGRPSLGPSIAIILLLLVMMVGYPARAAQISVTPMVQEISISPSHSETRVITLTNQGDEGFYIQVSLVDWLKNEDGESIFMDSRGSHPRSNLEWLKLEPVSFYIAPRSQQHVRVTMEAPEGVGPGSYWSMMVFEFFHGELPLSQNGVEEPFGRLAMGIYGIIEPGVREAEVVDMEIGEVRPGGKISATLGNTGNVHLRCTGQLVIADTSGQEKVGFPIPNALVFPGTQVKVTIPLPHDLHLAPGKYRVLALFDYGGDFYIAGEKIVEVNISSQ